MRAQLKPSFGKIPDNADNLEIVGEFPRCIETWDKATVWPRSGAVCRSQGVVKTESIWIKANLDSCGDYHSKWSWFPRYLPGTYFNLSLFWWDNYYHWHCDVLPRLLRVLPEMTDEVRIILPPDLKKWQLRSLELIGLNPDRCVAYTDRRPWKVERLLWAAPVAMSGDHDMQAMVALRDLIWRKLNCTPVSPGGRRLFLIRRNTHGRRIENEKEILSMLLSHGFEPLDCGAVDYDTQVKLFTNAECVVAPHGAALTNLIWAPPATKVFEIFESGSVRRCYWSLCKALGHQHACGVGESVVQTGRDPDMWVDVTALEKALKSFFDSASAPAPLVP